MSRTDIITGIDLGTDKCVTIIAAYDKETQELRVMGVSAVSSRGIKDSQIIDLEQALRAITESLDSAERMAGIEVKSAFVAVSGVHINSLNSKGVVAVASPDQVIIQTDVTRVIEAARAVSLPSDREIIHIIPKHYSVDSQNGIKDPIGMTGVRLETEAHIITGLTSILRNIEKCISDLGVNVEAFVFSGLSSSEVVLSETEKELGVVVVDIGAGSTSICAYVDGSLEHSSSIPVGARYITKDIAMGCRVSMDVAEKIKLFLTNESLAAINPNPGESKQEFNKRKKTFNQLTMRDLGLPETDEVFSKKTIIEGFMMPRMKEILTIVGGQLEKKKLFSLVPAGLVITGGGAQTVAMVDLAKHTLQLPARVGIPVELQGLTGDIHSPAYATTIGLLVYGSKQLTTSSKSGFSMPDFSFGGLANLPQKIIKAIQGVLP